ncbi:MAG: Fpg/Nei family DNA glycosylase [Candidatus Lokiarchaeota archaeon]|nr:Fpg/Nei family DNA glycosylase [Candidatus Lokiarchaeota archaeon]
MPELPEVETFKRYLDKTSLKQMVTDVKVSDARILSVDHSVLKKSLINKKFESSIRHGKYLFIFLNPEYLVLHFGMTGDLEYYSKKDEEPRFSKVIFYFKNDFNLAYISTRMFGRVSIVNSVEEFVNLKKLGPDAFKMSLEDFAEALNRRTAILKNALLNQSFIAGVGNIYSDEIMFRTKLHPRTKIDGLSETKKQELYENIKYVLKFGIEHKGDLSTYPKSFLIPHRKKDEMCPICNTKIEDFELSGRHGFFCPNCQKE